MLHAIVIHRILFGYETNFFGGCRLLGKTETLRWRNHRLGTPDRQVVFETSKRVELLRAF
jgi:hypothetical protein